MLVGGSCQGVFACSLRHEQRACPELCVPGFALAPSPHPGLCPVHSPTTQSLNAFTNGVCARASGYTR